MFIRTEATGVDQVSSEAEEMSDAVDDHKPLTWLLFRLHSDVVTMMKMMMMSLPPVCTLKVVHQQIRGLICFNEVIIGLIRIHLVQRPADPKHEERLRNPAPRPPSSRPRPLASRRRRLLQRRRSPRFNLEAQVSNNCRACRRRPVSL